MRSIIWSEEFARDVEHSGGARLIDEALSPVMDSLMRNPYGFRIFENDFTSFRYAKTAAIPGKAGELTIVFTIEPDKSVVLRMLVEDLPF